jgi:hypothetical protein
MKTSVWEKCILICGYRFDDWNDSDGLHERHSEQMTIFGITELFESFVCLMSHSMKSNPLFNNQSGLGRSFNVSIGRRR